MSNELESDRAMVTNLESFGAFSKLFLRRMITTIIRCILPVPRPARFSSSQTALPSACRGSITVESAPKFEGEAPSRAAGRVLHRDVTIQVQCTDTGQLYYSASFWGHESHGHKAACATSKSEVLVSESTGLNLATLE